MEIKTKKPLWKRKPFRILQVLDETELNGFGEFLETTIFNSAMDRRLVEFFQYCRQFIVWETEMDREQFLEKSGMDLSNNAFDKVVSRLYTALLNYTGTLGFFAEPSHALPYSLKYLAEKSISGEEIEKKLADSKRLLEKDQKNADYFRISMEMNLVLAAHSNSRMDSPDERGLHLLHEDLDAYFFIQKLRFLCASVNEQAVFRTYMDLPGEAFLMDWFTARYADMPDLAKIYYHAYMILSGQGEADDFARFKFLLQAWEKENGELPDTNDLYGYLLNHYIVRLNGGDIDCLPQLNALQDDLLAKGSILEEGKISPEHFKNIVSVKCRNGLVNEARAFFNSYVHLLTDEQEGAAERYNHAYILFYEDKQDPALEILEELTQNTGVTKADHFYGLNLRCLLLKCYYNGLKNLDLDKWDETEEKLRGLLRSFQGYIERKNISKMAQIRFENFRKGVQKLYNMYYLFPGDGEIKRREEELLLEFKSSTNLLDKAWFILQIQQQKGF